MISSLHHGFTLHVDKPRTVLIGSSEGMTPILHLSEMLTKNYDAPWQQLVLLQSDVPFPFRIRPSTIMVDGMPDGAIAAPTLLDEQGIASRLCSSSDFPGCHDGNASDLAAAWLGTLNKDALRQVELFVCGPDSLLQACAQVARRFEVACQLAKA